MMMDKKLNPTILPPTSINEQVNLTTPTAAPAEPRKPINFKKANKAPNVLQPKAKQPTNEVIPNEEAPVISPKKVNFKKALKK